MWCTFSGACLLSCVEQKKRKKVLPTCSHLMRSHSHGRHRAWLQIPAPLEWRGVALSVPAGGQCYQPCLVAWAEALLLLVTGGPSSQTTRVSGAPGIQVCCNTPALLSHQQLPRQLWPLQLPLTPTIFSASAVWEWISQLAKWWKRPQMVSEDYWKKIHHFAFSVAYIPIQDHLVLC